MSELIVGEAWAKQYPDKYVDLIPPTPKSCPICQHPTGDCTHEMMEGSMEPIEPVKKVAAKSVRPPSAGKPVAAKRAEPPPPAPDGFVADVANPQLITAQRDVHLSFTPRNAKRESTVMLFHAGQQTTVEGYHKKVARYRDYNNIEVK